MKLKKNVQIKSEEEGKKRKTRSYFRFHKYKTTLQAENIKNSYLSKKRRKNEKIQFNSN